jgi:hypothetical protein
MKGGKSAMGTLYLDFSKVWEQAIQFVNMLWPIFVIPIGLVLGVGLLNFVVRTVRGAISSF